MRPEALLKSLFIQRTQNFEDSRIQGLKRNSGSKPPQSQLDLDLDAPPKLTGKADLSRKISISSRLKGGGRLRAHHAVCFLEGCADASELQAEKINHVDGVGCFF